MSIYGDDIYPSFINKKGKNVLDFLRPLSLNDIMEDPSILERVRKKWPEISQPLGYVWMYSKGKNKDLNDVIIEEYIISKGLDEQKIDPVRLKVESGKEVDRDFLTKYRKVFDPGYRISPIFFIEFKKKMAEYVKEEKQRIQKVQDSIEFLTNKPITYKLSERETHSFVLKYKLRIPVGFKLRDIFNDTKTTDNIVFVKAVSEDEELYKASKSHIPEIDWMYETGKRFVKKYGNIEKDGKRTLYMKIKLVLSEKIHILDANLINGVELAIKTEPFQNVEKILGDILRESFDMIEVVKDGDEYKIQTTGVVESVDLIRTKKNDPIKFNRALMNDLIQFDRNVSNIFYTNDSGDIPLVSKNLYSVMKYIPPVSEKKFLLANEGSHINAKLYYFENEKEIVELIELLIGLLSYYDSKSEIISKDYENYCKDFSNYNKTISCKEPNCSQKFATLAELTEHNRKKHKKDRDDKRMGDYYEALRKADPITFTNRYEEDPSDGYSRKCTGARQPIIAIQEDIEMLKEVYPNDYKNMIMDHKNRTTQKTDKLICYSKNMYDQGKKRKFLYPGLRKTGHKSIESVPCCYGTSQKDKSLKLKKTKKEKGGHIMGANKVLNSKEDFGRLGKLQRNFETMIKMEGLNPENYKRFGTGGGDLDFIITLCIITNYKGFSSKKSKVAKKKILKEVINRFNDERGVGMQELSTSSVRRVGNSPVNPLLWIRVAEVVFDCAIHLLVWGVDDTKNGEIISLPYEKMRLSPIQHEYDKHIVLVTFIYEEAKVYSCDVLREETTSKLIYNKDDKIIQAIESYEKEINTSYIVNDKGVSVI